MTDPSTAAAKSALRREALARRDALAPDVRADASRAIADRVLSRRDLLGAGPVGAYWPVRSEVDTRPLIEALAGHGTPVALARIHHPDLSWRLWRPGDALIKGAFGVGEPLPDAPACSPAALLVPLAAFDRRGGRLGYGKGHFDRSIAALSDVHPVLAIGLAFGVQEMAEIPLEPHDRRLDWVVTEREIIRTGI
ncbi:5-formyltetrahydrofolate cyclo-ligase [Salinarimonas soli]|uniref:5-formyltetrahydrofolate cyclo-ligase n=1 Tax=Salinarimonas soli TaxID=1638099 RepID=A0A5B2V8C5_9HYPH|nr:5-formyltetrahydrofolate cyclo-ligase [Salinarimonas soli]KAA2235743.1 5-formyltetrahydrofolate cyclo-ligase [Salinarimonas soli]